MKLTADEFNAKFPIGTPVLYWSVLPAEPWCPPVRTKTRTPAWNLGHGAPVVSVEGRAGGVCLGHVELDDGRAEVAVEKARLPTPPALTRQLDAMTAAREEEERIRCPHCEHVQDINFCDGYDELVTLWGDDNGPAVTEINCEDCDEPFQVREKVRRTFDVAKVGEDFE